MKTRPGISRMGYTGFVPHIDNVNSLANRDAQDFIQMISHERKDVPDTELCHGPDEQFGARWHALACLVPVYG